MPVNRSFCGLPVRSRHNIGIGCQPLALSISDIECLPRAYHSQKGKISERIDGPTDDEVFLDIDTAGSH